MSLRTIQHFSEEGESKGQEEDLMSQMEDVIKMLDAMTEAGVGRIKVETSEALGEGAAEKAYHHGRCDVGSPFATGQLFDLEDEAGEESRKCGDAVYRGRRRE